MKYSVHCKVVKVDDESYMGVIEFQDITRAQVRIWGLDKYKVGDDVIYAPHNGKVRSVKDVRAGQLGVDGYMQSGYWYEDKLPLTDEEMTVVNYIARKNWGM